MPLSQSSRDLFDSSLVGDGLLTTLDLPAETFPRTGTWNQAPSLSNAAQARLSNAAFNSPPAVSNKSHLARASTATLTQSFIRANAEAVRFSPSHRLWTPSDLFALPQRGGTSCHLVMLRMMGSTNDRPFLCFAGPMATPLQGLSYTTASVFNQTPNEPTPLLHPLNRLPTTIAPTTFSLAPAPRTLVADNPPEQLLTTIRAEGALVSSLSADDAHQIIPVFDVTDQLHDSVRPDDPGPCAHLWIPAISSDPPTPDGSVIKPWLQSDTLPPNPTDLQLWDAGSTTATRPGASPYRPTPRSTPARMHAPETTPGDRPSFLLVPKFLRLPSSVPFPTGFVMHPAAITPANLMTLLTDLTDVTADTYQWMDNPLLTAWLSAAVNDPDAFAIPIWPHSAISVAFPSSAPVEAFSIRAHQEWCILNQLIWDHAFAHASGQGGAAGNQALRLTHYANSLVLANNSDAPTSFANHWGFIHSAYNHPFLTRLRPPSRASSHLIPGKWSTLAEAPTSDLPSYIRDFTSIPIEIRDRGKPKIHPLTLEPITEHAAPADEPTATFDLWNTRRSLFDTPLTTSPRASSKRPPDPATFDFSSPKRQSQPHPVPTVLAPVPPVDTPNPPLSPPTRRSPRLARGAPIDSHPAATQPHIPVHDPNDVIFAPASTPGASDPWRLPCFQDGQSRLPSPTSPNDLSPALSTALRQCTPVEPVDPVAAKDDKALLSFQFRPALMLSANVQYRDIVHRIAHWGAFRCVMPGDPKPTTITIPLAQYPDDWHCAPGHLSPTLLPHFQEAYRRTSSHHALAIMTDWFKQRAATALRDIHRSGPPGRFQPTWFSQPVMTAILTFSFKSGTVVCGAEAPTSFLTPWHFITSTPETYSATDIRIPPRGLEALKIFDIIRNMVFLFHLCYLDVHDVTVLGPGHSTFSRFSPLAGRLLCLADRFADRSFQIKWDRSHSRETYTQAVFCAISKLWNIFDMWQEEKFAPGDTYRPATAASNPHLILLNPVVDAHTRESLLSMLLRWDADISVFTIAQLDRPVPRDGLFNETTPECFLPRHTRTGDPHPSRSGDQRHRSSFSTPSSSGPSTRRHDDLPGESPRTAAARLPMIHRVDPAAKPLNFILRELNITRSSHNKLMAPRLEASQQLCFQFTTANSGGCNPRNGRKCPHAHVDLDDPNRCRQQAQTKFFEDLVALLTHDDIKRFYKPTQALRDFTGRR